ncbi:Ku protein [Streptomyces sp. NBC_00829]|uniref:Ku protein n=1 Tax=Streptomyces sp. NBC_00829 TaxID=2903679 RepID=UPI003868274E
MAIAKYAWSGRERLGLLRVRDNVIVLHAMRWADEIRDQSQLKPEEVELTEGEIAQAEQPIDAKRENREPPTAEEPEEAPGQIVDLMAALKESVAKAKASRGEDATVHDMPKKKTTAKRTTTKKTAKKQPAKKAAKKTAARKPRRSA